MKLGVYLELHGETFSAFAKRIGRSHTTIGRLVRAETRPDWATLAAIERETGGAVMPNDFRGNDGGYKKDTAA